MISVQKQRALLASVVAVSVVGLASAFVPRANAAGNVRQPFPPAYNGPKEMPGEVLVRLAPGVSAIQLATDYGLTVKRKLRFAPQGWVVFSGVPGNLATAVQQLRRVPGVLHAQTNGVYLPQSLPIIRPNDPLFNEQWALQLIRAKEMWGITVGERFINGPPRSALVGMIDLEPDTSHPDLRGHFDPNGYDFIQDQPLGGGGFFGGSSHATNVAGCIVATPNDGSGIAALPFEAVSILACVAGDSESTTNFTTPVIQASAVVDAIYYCMQQGVDIINMSFALTANGGFGQGDAAVTQACTDAYAQGIVLVGAAGNSPSSFFGDQVAFPASLDSVIAVGAVGPSGEHSYYSQTGPELDLAAPGGNDQGTTNDAARVICTDAGGFFGSGVAYQQGTSLAAAYVSSAVATLITQGAVDENLTPTEQIDQLRDLLQNTARSPSGGQNITYGFGIIDMEAAMKAATHYIDISSPEPNEVTASFAEPVEFQIVQPIPHVLQQDEFDVQVNGTSYAADAVITDQLAGRVTFEPTSQNRYSIGTNRINIEADSAVLVDGTRSMTGPAVGNIPERSYQFRVRPHITYPGVQTLSVPFQFQNGSDDLQFIFGGNLIRLARWVTLQRRYAIFDVASSPQDPQAALLTTDAGVAKRPIGVGFWARVTSTTQVQILGRSERAGLYRIPLSPGWTLIGNPYPFRVPFSACSVQFGNEILSVAEAARRGLMKDYIWRYVDGGYKFSVLPTGQLVDWEGSWLYSNANLTLLVPRIASQFAGNSLQSPAAPRYARKDGAWSTKLRAMAGGRLVGEVGVGRTRLASIGQDRFDVLAPPSPDQRPEFRVKSRSSGLALAQDVRPASGGSQRWVLEVATLRPSTAVQLSWADLPVGRELRVRLPGEARTRGLRPGKTLEFKPQAAGVHQIVLEEWPHGA